MKMSPSAIRTWMKCPMQAKFRYIDGLPEVGKNAAAEFGSAVHYALEKLNEGSDIDSVKEVFLEQWELMVQDEEVVLPPKATFSKYRENGLKMIDQYVESRKWDSDQIIGQEVRFKVPFGRHEISGIIDRLSVNSEQIRVMDYKTGYRPNANNLHLDIQFTSYMYAVSRPEFWTGVEGSDKYKGFPDGEKMYEKYASLEKVGIWLDLRNAKEYNVGPRGKADFVRLYRCLDQIENAIEKEVFVPNISGDTCKFCSFQKECPAYLTEEQIGKDLKIGD